VLISALAFGGGFGGAFGLPAKTSLLFLATVSAFLPRSLAVFSALPKLRPLPTGFGSCALGAFTVLFFSLAAFAILDALDGSFSFLALARPRLLTFF
jgi:uncharacterized membrane protein